MLIVIRGCGGAGKSTIASRLAYELREKFHVSLLSVDWFNLKISGRNPKGDLVYDAMKKMIKFYLNQDHIVVLEGILISQDGNQSLKLNKITDSLKKDNLNFKVFKLDGNLKTLENREKQKFQDNGWKFDESNFREWYYASKNRKFEGELTINIEDKTPEKIAKEIIDKLNLEK